MGDWIECELAQILIMSDDLSNPQVIVLREKSGLCRSFAIHIGLFEALAINREIHEEFSPRPLTHELITTIISQLGCILTHVSIVDLRSDEEGNGTFIAQLCIKRISDDNLIYIDCRSSDAIVLALRSKCPIFVSLEVLEILTDNL